MVAISCDARKGISDVRFGSKADMCSALADVCFGPKADIDLSRLPDLRAREVRQVP